MAPSDRTYYGTVRAQIGNPPSRGTPTLTVVLPAELARTWPSWATHVHVTADPDGLHLRPVDARPRLEDRPVPFEAPHA